MKERFSLLEFLPSIHLFILFRCKHRVQSFQYKPTFNVTLGIANHTQTHTQTVMFIYSRTNAQSTCTKKSTQEKYRKTQTEISNTLIYLIYGNAVFRAHTIYTYTYKHTHRHIKKNATVS